MTASAGQVASLPEPLALVREEVEQPEELEQGLEEGQPKAVWESSYISWSA